MKKSSGFKAVCSLGLGAFFSVASVWVPVVRDIRGHHLFISVESMTLLGMTLLLAFLAMYVLPDAFLTALSRLRARFMAMMTRPALLLCGLVALGMLLTALCLINQRILHGFLSSADEHSCYFLAECLRRGKLYVEIPSLADFFRVVHVGMKGGKWFSVYPPGWPLLWAMGIELRIADWINPALSVLSLVFFYLTGKKLFGRRAAALGMILTVLNPFFLFTAASYFSHAACLLCVGVFLYAFLRWREGLGAGKDPVGWAFLCAFAMGYGLMTRYLTVAAIAAPFLLYHYFSIFLEWRGWGHGLPFAFKRPRIRKSDWVALAVIGVFMAIVLWQNYLVTGKPFRAPNKYDKSWERLGFRKDYTPLDGLFYLVARIFFLMDWFAPAAVGLYLWILVRRGSLGMIAGLKASEMGAEGRRVLRLFFLVMPLLALAYFFYYSWGGNQWGPRYLWEGLPFLCLVVAGWLVVRWRLGGVHVRKFLFAFTMMLFMTSGVLFVKQTEFVEQASRERRALYDQAESTIQGQGIVFIRGFLGNRLVLSEDDAVRNSPFLDGRILYAHDLGARNEELIAAYPGRKYYRGWYDRSANRPVLEKIAT